MKNIFFLALLILSFFSCSENGGNEVIDLKGDVTINFQGLFKNQPLVMFDDVYAYEDGIDLRFQLFQFYISDVSLVKEMNDTINGTQELMEVALVSFKDIQSTQAASEGITFKLEDIPAGEYKGIKLGIGVANQFNRMQPGDFAAGHPLSDNYWSASKGYIFSKIEGNADLNGDGTFSEKLTFHIGAESLYNEKIFINAFEVKANDELDINFTIDLFKVLSQGSGDFINFNEVTQDHTNNMEIASFISQNIGNALALELE
ncbi:MAG: MbnP family protein [Bacteroidota bacterium]